MSSDAVSGANSEVRANDDKTQGEAPQVDALRWSDLFGIDPDYCEGVPVDEWLEANRGEA